MIFHFFKLLCLYTYVKLRVVNLVNIVNTCMLDMCGEVKDPNQRISDIHEYFLLA